MVAKLFCDHPPDSTSRILDPGCADGAFVGGVIRWCASRGIPIPEIVGVESDPKRASLARKRFASYTSVTIVEEDFLESDVEQYDYIVGNPPYVPITELSEGERDRYRNRYETAKGRFDLYLLFFEQALRSLKPNGRLVLITPEKYLYVNTAVALRLLLGQVHVEEIHLVEESTFGELVTYPTITTVVSVQSRSETRVILRDGSTNRVTLGQKGNSWLPLINGADALGDATQTLADICTRISCGVATGADSVYVVRNADLEPTLRHFAFPTLAGREIGLDGSVRRLHSMLIPYRRSGELIPEENLGALGQYLRDRERKGRLMRRTCVSRKPWYAFHENPPLKDILHRKILCKDITPRPIFVLDNTGTLVPRHSVYYVVPRNPALLEDLLEYLNSPTVDSWLRTHCQRAANGFLRLQSHVLKRLPVPRNLEVESAREAPELATAAVAPS